MNSTKLDVLMDYCMLEKNSYERFVWLCGILGLKPPTEMKYQYYLHYWNPTMTESIEF